MLCFRGMSHKFCRISAVFVSYRNDRLAGTTHTRKTGEGKAIQEALRLGALVGLYVQKAHPNLVQGKERSHELN